MSRFENLYEDLLARQNDIAKEMEALIKDSFFLKIADTGKQKERPLVSLFFFSYFSANTQSTFSLR